MRCRDRVEPMSVDMGFKAGENVVTVARYTGGDVIAPFGRHRRSGSFPTSLTTWSNRLDGKCVFTVGLATGAQSRKLILSL